MRVVSLCVPLYGYALMVMSLSTMIAFPLQASYINTLRWLFDYFTNIVHKLKKLCGGD